MRYISTTDTNITFTDVDGKVKIVPKNRVYTHFNVDTVTFLLIERYDNEGICLFSTKAEDLEINGTTYTYEQLLDGEGISDLFSPTGLSFEVVEELPQTGEEGVIYLVPNEDETYTEYIWIADEERFEIIGTTDVDLTNYYTKAQVDALIPTEVSELTNDAGYITQEEVIINESFPSGWHTTGTMADLITDINADSDAVVGKSYMNTVSFSDLPSGISQAELKVDVISELQGEGKVLVFTVTSSDVSPYHWEYTSAYGASGTWRSWANSSDLANYYTKTQSNNLFATQVVVNQEIAARIQADADITTALGAKADKSDTYTKTQVDTALALKQDASTAFSGDYDDLTNKPDLTVYAESANLATVATSGDYNDLSNKPTIPVVPTNVSAFTNDAGYLTQHQSLADYYTKSETDAALAGKVSQTEFDTKEEVISTALNDLEENKQDKLTAGANITIDANNVISSTGGTQVQSDWNQSDSSAVDYIKNKPTIPDTSDFVSKAEYNPKEVAIAEALTELNENKADKSEIPVVPDMSNYYTKTETNNTFVSQADFDVKEEVISTALNDLNNKIGDIETILQSI